MKSMILGAAVLVAFASFASAQMGDQDSDEKGYQENNGAMMGQTGGSMSDANVAAMIKAIDEGEVKEAKIAKKRAKSKDVKKFAEMMIRDHGQNQQRLASLEKKIGVQPQSNDEVADLKSSVDDASQSLESETGSDFDQKYVDDMVDQHQKALKKLDNAIANNAGRNERLGEFLKKTRDTVKKHLDAAQKLQSQSGGGMNSNEGGENGGQ